MFNHKKYSHGGVCLVLHILVTVFMLLAGLASVIGVIMAHKIGSGAVFGTTVASLSLVAFAITMSCFMQQLKQCMMKCEACNGK